MKRAAIAATIVLLAAGSAPAFAAGCLKGAVVGGIAGHYAHHHAVLGAIAGCAVGHHMAVKAEQDRQRQLRMQHQQMQQAHGSQGQY
jgi:outer membrane lipoprotein SlyB